MKAIVIHQYGGPEVLRYEDFADPVPVGDEVLVRVAAASINPIDLLRRSGVMKDIFPISFPGILGADLSGTVLEGSGFSPGDRVFGMADQTYAELSVVKSSNLAIVPDGLDLIQAAALPLVTTTGNQLISVGTGITAGQTVFVTGAAGSVGRSAVFTAKDRGARVIAGVLRRQLPDAKSIGAFQVVATDDENAMGSLPPLDAVADTVGGKLAEFMLGKVKKGGVFASVLGAPPNAGDYPEIRVVPVYAEPDPKILLYMAQAVEDGRLVLPISQKLQLQDAEKGHAAMAKGGAGKIVLVVVPPTV